MRNTRILRQELDLWKVAWQQVETFLERIEGARDQDLPHLRKLDALLRAARVVEHERAARVDDRPLSDPVIDRMPQYWYSEQGGAQTIPDPWSLDFRKWRIPGMDAVELAVGNLATQAQEGALVLEKVGLLPDREIFETRIEQSDRRFPQSDNGLLMIRLPSYPGAETGSSIAAGAGAVDIAEDEDTSSLFSMPARVQAATAPDETQDPVRIWSDLCAARRNRLPNAREDYAQEVKFAGPSPQICWRMAFISETRDVIAAVRAGRASLDPEPAETLDKVARAARASVAVSRRDVDDLTLAAEVIREEGAQAAGFPDQLSGAANALQGRAQSFQALADAAGELLGDLNSWSKADRLEQALDALAAILTHAVHPLFQEVVESAAGLLQPEIDTVVQARVSYPDGTLRMVRALEWGFVSMWPARLRWFKMRNSSVLTPMLNRFIKPFVKSLFGLIHGEDSGFGCEGLQLGTPVQVGSQGLPSAQPASMLPALDDAIEAGQVAIVQGDRPVAAVVLGLGESGANLELKTSPLIVSLAAQGEDAPGSPGMVAGGQPIVSRTSALTQNELRRGRSEAGPAADGLVQQTIALWSRLCLVFGWREVEKALQGTEVGFSRRRIPDPSRSTLRSLRLHGEIEANTTTLVIHGAPNAFWDRSTDPPQPRIARAHEMLLLRGRGESEEEGQQGPMLQSVVEVENVYATTGSMMQQMETSGTAVLSTAERPVEATCLPPCGPEEDVIVVVLRQTWQNHKLVGEITLRRDFAGFEACLLASERLLPVSFVRKIVPSGTAIDAGSVDRRREFDAALKCLADWTRYAR